jgi:hypothetical protein
MNTNIQNQQNETLKTILKQIPVERFYSNVLTRGQVASIYDDYEQLIKSYPINDEQIIRTLLVECLRYVNMKVSQNDVFLVLGLIFIEREDLDILPYELAKKLSNENKDTSDLEVINRILAQINTKLPHDLQTRLTPIHKVNILQYLHRLLPVGENLATETFEDISSNKNNSNTSDANNFMKKLSDVFPSNHLNNLKEKGYNLSKLNKKMVEMKIDAGSYQQQLVSHEAQMRDLKQELTNKNKDEQKHIIRAKYIDTEPELHTDLINKEVHYYDEHSGALIPLSSVEVVENEGEEMTKKELENVLKHHDIPSDEVDDIHRLLKSGKLTLDTKEENTEIEAVFSKQTIIIIGVIAAILLFMLLFLLLK